MSWLGVFAILWVVVLPVRVQPVEGESYSAEVVEIDGDEVQVRVAGDVRTIAVEALSSIARQEQINVIPPVASVGLVDGSRLFVDSISIADDTATLKLPAQDPLAISVRKLAWVRFRAPNPAVDDAWLGLLGQPQTNDLIVIRRAGNVLDQVGGVVLSANDERVEFDSRTLSES